MSRIRDIANILSGGSSAIATDAEITSAVSNQFVAGKNKIINGDFGIWQRGTTGVNGFLADRWYLNAGAPTSFSQSRQAFTPGSAPVAGYEGKYFWRNTITTVGSSTEWYLNTYIEDVQTLAGQTATFSFWAKADSPRAMSGYLLQRFGDSGSANTTTTIGTASLTTSWQRFTFTISIPSLSGKTIGANNLVQIFFAMTPASGMVIDLWGVQLEAGSVATAFNTATESIQGELAACQRYFQRVNANSTHGVACFGQGIAESTTAVQIPISPVVTPRTFPTITFNSQGGFRLFDLVNAAPATTAMAVVNASFMDNGQFTVKASATGLTQYRIYQLIPPNGVAANIDISAEL